MTDSQPFQFDYLIDTSIKRLTRPKFRNDFEQYYDADNFKQQIVENKEDRDSLIFQDSA